MPQAPEGVEVRWYEERNQKDRDLRLYLYEVWADPTAAGKTWYVVHYRDGRPSSSMQSFSSGRLPSSFEWWESACRRVPSPFNFGVCFVEEEE